MLKLSEAYAFGDISRQALQAVFNQIFPGKSRVLFPHSASNAVGISKQETNWYFYNDPLLVNEDKFAFIEMLVFHLWIWDSSIKDYHNRNGAPKSYISIT